MVLHSWLVFGGIDGVATRRVVASATAASTAYAESQILTDSFGVVGSPISEFDLNLQILMGLGPDYEAFVTSVSTRSDELSTEELNGMLLNHEHRKEYFKLGFESGPFSANTTFRGPNNNNNNKSCVSPNQSSQYGRPNPPREHGQENYSKKGTNGPNNGQPSGPCQICKRKNHTAVNCYFRYAKNGEGSKSSYTTSSNSSTDHSLWYPDSGATNHLIAN
ncbi:PREDICTED: uncharacterized protein LOC104599610 [Nelumbo nucifera]|uniref:Uncharacterized protein LOC104599610 n=1 Tax=Nelumbo nucifera TaxID=4432 RepID=A0A1U8A2Q1_NELNU|nr:PREDICTED: uncharacterized protein LOC104599610 [Nelumbo nucifera]